MSWSANKVRGFLPALAFSLAASSAWAADPPAVKIDGAVLHPQSFSVADLKAMPSAQVDASFQTMHGAEHKLWTGVLVLDLLRKAELKNDGGKNAFLRHTLLVHGKDGYEAILAIGEIDPTGEAKRVILAYRDAADLPGLRLVVPGDLHGARQVHDVVEIEVK